MHIKLIKPFLTKGYSVRLRLVLFVIISILFVILISLSAVIGLNSTYHSFSDLRDRSQNEILLSMTLGVKATQISTYAIHLSQTIRALEYQESFRELEHYVEQVNELLEEVKSSNHQDNNLLFTDILMKIEALELSVKELLFQSHQRHILNTKIISEINQSLLHIRHIKRLENHYLLPEGYHLKVDQAESLIEKLNQNTFSPNVFLTMQAIFSDFPNVSKFQSIFNEWNNVDDLFKEMLLQSNNLEEINLRIKYLIYKINELSKQIDKKYTQLAKDKINEMKLGSYKIQEKLKQYKFFILLLSLFVILLIFILGSYIYFLIGKRLYSITNALIELSNGNKNVNVPRQKKQDEIGNLERAFHIFYQQVITLDKTDAMLKEKSNLLEQTYFAMRDGLAIFDSQLNLISCNEQFSSLLQSKKPFDRHWNLMRIANFLYEKDTKIYGVNQRINSTLLQEIRVEQEHLELEFCQQVMEWRVSPLKEGGIVIFLIDRTQRKRLENELAHNQKMRSIGHLTGGIAHDFNNFLAVIIGNLELIDRNVLTEKQANRLNRALKAAENSAILTQRLLAYARKQSLNPKVLNINELLLDFIDLIKHSLPVSIKIEQNLEDNLPLVYIDKNQLETALVNLIINAKDAIVGEGIIVVETQYKLVKRTYREEPMIQISIKDSGCGMDIETQKQVFEPFFTTKKQNKGSGLGLSMVYGFIRQSKGRINIDSIVGAGTTIYLQLPIATQNPIISEVNIKLEKINKINQGIILLIEDKQSLRETLSEQLCLAGYDTVTLESAEQAVEFLIKNNTQMVDYILSDISLVGMSGLELAEYIKQYYPKIYIILMTGNQTDLTEKELSFPILNKPFKQEVLLDLLDELKNKVS